MQTFTFYDGTIPHVTASLDALNHLFDKLEAYATQSNSSVQTLLAASLTPDMFPFAVQVYIATNMALQIAVHLQGIEPPPALLVGPDSLRTIADLRNHVRDMQKLFDNVDRQTLVGPNDEVTWNKGPLETKTSSAYSFVNGFAIPNMYFHVVTAYDILRKTGVDIGKADYLNHFLDRYMV